ncbi:MAG: hypothetical protein Q4F65_12695 [Propionibacteriaceae bacterium]|nr:hypothetical protein [Propionibacteriaceae bacterium]
MASKEIRGIKPGDGSELKPVTGLQWLWRGQFETEVDGHTYSVDVDYFDLAERSRLYRDGVQVAVGTGATRFALDDVEDTHIETKMSTYGMSRAHVVSPHGEEQMRPAPGTMEAWRADLHRDHRGLSLALGAVSWIVLVVALVIEVPQLLETLSNSGWWPHLTDWRPTAPITLPPAANIALTVAGVVAGLERALRLKHNWLLDE